MFLRKMGFDIEDMRRTARGVGLTSVSRAAPNRPLPSSINSTPSHPTPIPPANSR